jgi:Phenazine biosynthesis-like protein
MRRAFVTADVFTATKGAGNPLAVVLDCVGLTDTQMQTIAREFNISETTFVFPPKDPDQTAFVRIFTPARELPFAGHPMIGTAVVLAQRHKMQTGAPLSRMVLEVPLGLVEIEVADDPSGATSAMCAIPKLPVMHSPSPTVEQVAAALSLSPSRYRSGRAADPDLGRRLCRRIRGGKIEGCRLTREGRSVEVAINDRIRSTDEYLSLRRNRKQPLLRAHVCPDHGHSRGSCDRRRRRRSRRASSRLRQAWRRRAPIHHRPGRRHGATEPDHARNRGRAPAIAARAHRRRCGRISDRLV